MKKIAVILAEGFEEVEALTPVDLLRRARIGCDTVSLSGTKQVTGSHGISVQADLSFDSVNFEDYDGIVLPGGMPGTRRLAADERLLSLLGELHSRGKLTAAICAAPTVLAKAGLLAGKRAVCYPGMEDQLTGARVCYEEVCADGTVITSRGLGTAIPFALALISYLDSQSLADDLAKRVVFR